MPKDDGGLDDKSDRGALSMQRGDRHMQSGFGA
jgi:hypothetical protein